MDKPDYIVIGAGSAGCVVAARLSESGRHRVLLLEAGPTDGGFWLQMPMGYGKSYYDPKVNWMLTSEPNPGLGGRTVYVPRGKVLGGSSTINAMVYSRGQATDFEDWKAAGNPGWGWDEVLRTYRRLERHALGEGPWHGGSGPLAVSTIDGAEHPLTRAFVEAGRQAGLPVSRDLNGETIEGVGLYQITVSEGLRMSTARAYLRPARGRPNLRVLTGAHVTGLVLEGRAVTGVAYEHAGRSHVVEVGREVVLAAGAIASPQLLQLSGIGPAKVLTAAGVAVRHELPAVGGYLQDHICYDHIYRARRPSLNEELRPLVGKLRVGLAYLLARKGPLALSLNQGGGYFRSTSETRSPDIQLYFSPLSYERPSKPGERALLAPDPFPGFCTSASPCRPTSRGSITVASADPHRPPRIALGLLGTEEDAAAIVRGARFLRRLAATPAFSELIAEELKPGRAVDDDAALLEDARARAYSVFHPCGSCRMGPDPVSAVVDARLRVHGIGRLRVIDASIFPSITSGNINAPTIMVGERGAELMREDS